MKLTFSTANAFQKLKAPELAPIVEWIQAERQEALELMAVVGDEMRWRKAQGRAQLAQELLELVENSAELAAKLNVASR